MATFYLDYEGGNDANDGTTFANRWKTFASGATAARTAPGDTIRVMASPDETLVGDATWTQDSKTVALASAVTANISTCESAWTASANVTATTSATRKEGSLACSLAIAAGFTTGKVAYFATGTLDLSAYKQVSFWLRSSAAISAGVLTLRLCSDTTGDTVVDTIAIPAIASTAIYHPITVDLGAALGSAIASISISAASDPGTVTLLIDNIIACKDSTSADSLTLTSLIGKVHNRVWQASTAYAANAIRKPTQPNRNGFRYKVTAGGGGNSGGTEPTWPEYVGATVSDGALTWTCEGLEDTWYPIQSINGTTVLLDNGTNTSAAAGRGYSRETETVSTYKRETIKTGMSSAGSIHTFQEAGTADAPIVYTGGWNRTDMSTQTGETWMDNQNQAAVMYNPNSRAFIDLYNLNATRCQRNTSSFGSFNRVFNSHASGLADNNWSSGAVGLMLKGICGVNGNTLGFATVVAGGNTLLRATLSGHLTSGVSTISTTGARLIGGDITCENNGSYGVDGFGDTQIDPVYNVTTRGNATAGVNVNPGVAYLFNANLQDATPISAATAFNGSLVYSQHRAGNENDHLIFTDGGTIVSATDQRNTASGISWKFLPTSVNRHARYPLRLSVAKVAIAASDATTISIYARRDSTDIKGRICIPGGQTESIPNDIATAMEPSVNTWTQYSVNITPSENCVIEVFVEVWDGVGTTNAYWVDDLSVT